MTHSEELLREYLLSRDIVFQYEQPVPGKSQRPDFQVEHGGATIWLEVKESKAPVQRPTTAFDPLLSIVEKIDQGRKKFKEFKSCCCGLVIHSCESIFRSAHIDHVVAAAFGQNTFYPLRADRVEDTPRRFRFSGSSKLNRDSNTTISSIILLQHWEVKELWVDVRNELLDRQSRGERIMPGADMQLLAERQDEPVRITHPNTTRCVVLKNPFAQVPFPNNVFDGPFDQRWGLSGDVYTLQWMGSGLEKLRQRPKLVPYDYL